MLVVLGAFGRTGRGVAARARAAGQGVRMVTRRPTRSAADVERLLARAGRVAGLIGAGARTSEVEVAVANLLDEAALERAVRGASALYAILPDDLRAIRFHAERRAMAENVAAAIVREQIPRVVLLSSWLAALGEQADSGLGADLAYFERVVRDTDTALTILRPCYFQDNIVGALPLAKRDGVYLDLLPSGSPAIDTIAAADVAAFAARSLLEPPRETFEVIELVGPSYSAADIAAALGSVLGRQVSVTAVSESMQSRSSCAWMSTEAADAMMKTLTCLGSASSGAAGEVDQRNGRRAYGGMRLEQVLEEAWAHEPESQASEADR